ncbi:MAG: hypothetical protein ACK4ME_03440 [Fimbriimonadales bacterium]
MKRRAMRWGLSAIGAVLLLGSVNAQQYRLVVDQQSDPTNTLARFTNLDTNTNVGTGAFVTRGRLYAQSPSSVNTNTMRVRLESFTGGGAFGRLGIYFGNINRNSNSSYQLPLDRSNNPAPANTGTFAYFGTWVGSGHQFGMRVAGRGQGTFQGGQVYFDAEIRNASMLSLTSGPSPSQPNLAPYLWGAGNIDPTVFPNIALNWGFGAITGARGLINFVQFGNIASPHSDRLILRTTL